MSKQHHRVVGGLVSALIATGCSEGPRKQDTETPPACPEGQQDCGGLCVVTATDTTNCGACGVACASLQQCVSGACSCISGTTLCGTRCVDTLGDPTNCGGCGNACGGAEVCSLGVCSTECADGLVQCGQSCADLATSAFHCGDCAVACSSAQSCVGGVCTCPAGQTLCAGACVDVSSNALHCGGCDLPCATGACQAGVCTGDTAGTGGSSTGSGGAASGSGGAVAGGTGGAAAGVGGAAAGSGGTVTGGSSGGGVGGTSPGSGGDPATGGSSGSGGLVGAGGGDLGAGGTPGAGGDVAPGGSAGAGGGTAGSGGASAGAGGLPPAVGGSAGGGGQSAGGTPGVGGDVGTGGTPGDGSDVTALLNGTPDEQVLRLSLRFYGAERCGDTGNWIIADHTLGGTCHLQDGQSEGLDLSGGWHDAGDHVKVTLTIAYAAYIMVKAYDVYPTAFDDLDGPYYAGVPNGVPDVLDEARFGLDWLVKAHPDPNTLIAMVANADYDHETFVTSPYQSTLSATSGGDPRPVQRGGAADFAGLAAAALALASRVYAPYDSALAATYLEKARSAYAYGQANPGLSDSQLYAWMGTNWEDDMLCAAAELYVATSDAQYLSDAQSWNLDTANYPRTYWVASYGQVADFCRHTLVDAGEGAALGPWQDEVDDYRASISADPDLSGLVYYDQWGTCRYALSAGFSSALLYEVTGDTQYRDFALSQYDWVKGNNPYGRSFIVGWGTNPPQRPHHRNAFGHDDTQGFDDPSDPQMNNGIPFEHVLWGALVGGPTPADGYADDMNDYQRNEVAIDYNAGLVGSAAFAVALERGN